VNLETIQARIGEIDAELAELRTLEDDDDGDFTEDDQTRFDELAAEFDDLDEKRQRLMARNERLAKVRAAVADPTDSMRTEAVPDGHTPVPPVQGVRDLNPYDTSTIRGTSVHDLKARAKKIAEEARAVPDSYRQELTGKLEAMSDSTGALAQLTIVTSSDDYRSAYAKALAGLEQTFTTEEARAVATVEEYRTALSLTQSGYAVPAVIDPTVVLTSAGVTNPFRQVARQVSITANSWKPITSGGVTASFDAEAAEVSDDSPTLAQPEITAYMARAFAIGSVEMSEDWAQVGAELTREFVDAKNTLEAGVFATGTGSNQPIGITKALDGGSYEIDPITGETFVLADAINLVKAVPPRFRQASTAVLMHLGTINKIRALASTDGYEGLLKDPTLGSPGSFQGYPLLEASTMRDYDLLDAAATADNFLIVVGDWNQYVIVDRIGMSVELVPHLFATANNLPSGQRGWFGHWRTGADSIADSAFRMLSIPTAA
jgi:HK97 family phage major capsid protein